jgi:hypothetical protein
MHVAEVRIAIVARFEDWGVEWRSTTTRPLLDDVSQQPKGEYREV